MPKIANVKMPMTKDGTIDKRCSLIGDIRKSENPSCKNK